MKEMVYRSETDVDGFTESFTGDDLPDGVEEYEAVEKRSDPDELKAFERNWIEIGGEKCLRYIVYAWLTAVVDGNDGQLRWKLAEPGHHKAMLRISLHRLETGPRVFADRVAEQGTVLKACDHPNFGPDVINDPDHSTLAHSYNPEQGSSHEHAGPSAAGVHRSPTSASA